MKICLWEVMKRQCNNLLSVILSALLQIGKKMAPHFLIFFVSEQNWTSYGVSGEIISLFLYTKRGNITIHKLCRNPHIQRIIYK